MDSMVEGRMYVLKYKLIRNKYEKIKVDMTSGRL